MTPASTAPPFRVGVMQLTMEPLEEIVEHARAMEEAGFDTIWLAEAYPWWRKHSMEARSSTALSALVARETRRLAVGWGIVSPFTRHPIQIAMEARVTQEAAGPGRFLLGLGVSKIFMRHAGLGEGSRPVAAMKEAVEIVRALLRGDELDVRGRVFEAHVPALREDADAPRWEVPVYVAGTGPMMLRAAAQVGDGLLTASITTPAFVRYVRERVAEAGRDPDSLDIGCTVVASIDEDRDRGREGAREIAGMYLANKVQNIQGAADTLLELAGLSQEEVRPIAEAMERGGRLAAKAAVSDEILDKCVPIAGNPDDCVAAIEAYRAAGCTHVMLELWGEDRLRQLRLFGERVLPHVR
ncbi:MAG TPA: LLM class flavin-dependent oxidoreductase [Gaiellaceae bacterium]|nr:LLM class flavin-dependent oxidoreductase [Gaiellaceae bacterium]